MNYIGKLYTLKNGWHITKAECYDGYQMQYFWAVLRPDRTHYKNCGSFNVAMATAQEAAARDERNYARYADVLEKAFES